MPTLRPCSMTLPLGPAVKGHGASMVQKRQEAELGRQKGMPGQDPVPDLLWAQATQAGCCPEPAASEQQPREYGPGLGLLAL